MHLKCAWMSPPVSETPQNAKRPPDRFFLVCSYWAVDYDNVTQHDIDFLQVYISFSFHLKPRQTTRVHTDCLGGVHGKLFFTDAIRQNAE